MQYVDINIACIAACYNILLDTEYCFDYLD